MKKLLIVVILISGVNRVFAQPGYDRELWLQKAEASKKPLIHVERVPERLIEVIPDEQAFFGYRAAEGIPLDSLPEQVLNNGDKIVLDFGDHMVGRLSFHIKTNGPAADAPTRLQMKFGEILPEVVEPYDPYHGKLSHAWLQDKVITIDTIPGAISLPRRYAFRYLSVKVIATSPVYDIQLSDFTVDQVSAVQMKDIKPLPATTSAKIKRIDHVSNRTLQDCMQMVYEDGPKRDRRLWVGDLRLQALTNYQTFNDLDLVKRSLYLLAGVSNENGRVPGCVFEVPYPHRQENFPLDYSLLFNSTIYDYVEHTNDLELAADLWPVIKKQVELSIPYLEEGVFIEPNEKNLWIFVDWKPGLDKQVAMHGIMIYSFRHTYEIAKKLGRTKEVDFLPGLIKKMTKSALNEFYNDEQELFISGKNYQVSIASQVWMILSGVVNEEKGARIMGKVLTHNKVVTPAAPYLYHYQLDAMLACGMKEKAVELMLNYWGSMIDNGADTFWEVYDPGNADFSPYNSILVNSYCHAWSCTPSYFIRKYPGIFRLNEND